MAWREQLYISSAAIRKAQQVPSKTVTPSIADENAELRARITAPEAERERLRGAVREFLPFAQVAFLWPKSPPDSGEMERYRAAYRALGNALNRVALSTDAEG